MAIICESVMPSAAGPADLLQAIADRLRDDHVAGDHHSERVSSGTAAAQALVASTTLVACTEPWGSASRCGRSRVKLSTLDCSKICTPCLSATRRSPRTSLAG